MRKQPYRAEAVEIERRARRARAEAALARARDALAVRLAALARCEQAFDELAKMRQGQSATPAKLTGAELARGAAFARRQQLELVRRRGELERAKTALRMQERSVQTARQALARALADERVIERDRARHVSAQRRRGEQAEELELEEVTHWRPR